MKPVSFGSGTRVYTFPTQQGQFRTNFGNVVPATVRLPLLDGGFDNMGDDPAPSEIGNITFDFTLISDTRADMEAQRDSLMKIKDWGVQRLYAQPSDPAANIRWCSARLNSIELTQRNDLNTDLWQRVSMSFQAPDPRWYDIGTESATWGSGLTWGSLTQWGGTVTPQACSGFQTDYVLTRGGSANTRPRITISCGAGQTATNPKVQRLVNGLVRDEVSWVGTLLANESLEINCRAWTVKKNGVDAYSSAFGFLNADWLQLEPGANAIRVLFANSGDAASIYMRYYEVYR